jgi:hypothetical protein
MRPTRAVVLPVPAPASTKRASSNELRMRFLLGYRLHGWPGAILSVIAFILPSFLLVLALTLAYLQYGSLPQVSGVSKGIGAAVVALVLATAYRMGMNAVKDRWSTFGAWLSHRSRYMETDASTRWTLQLAPTASREAPCWRIIWVS